MSKYKYNRLGVCINPNTVSYQNGNTKYELLTARAGNMWVYGYRASHSSNASLKPVSMYDTMKFHTQRQALINCACVVLSFFEEPHYSGNANSSTPMPKTKEVIASLNNIIENEVSKSKHG